LHPSANPKIFVLIGPLGSEPLGQESRPLKYKKIKKNIGKIYSPSGKFAERAKLEMHAKAQCITRLT